MNIFRLTGDLSHLAAIVILLLKIWKTRSCAGERRARPRAGSGAGPGAPEDRRPRPPHVPRGRRRPDTPPLGRPAGRRTAGGLRPLWVGAAGRGGRRGAGPRSAPGRLPNLNPSRRRGGGVTPAARVPVLPEKFGGWGGGSPACVSLAPGFQGRLLGTWAGVRGCGDPASPWDGREEDGQDRGRRGLTWQPGRCGCGHGRGGRSPGPAPCPREGRPLGAGLGSGLAWERGRPPRLSWGAFLPL